MRKSLKNKKPLAILKKRRYYTRVNRGLVWGNSGIKALSRILLPRRRLRWIRIWLKWHYKKKFRKFTLKVKKHERYYWFRIKSCMPCTRKSEKSRMGKGKGKLVGSFAHLTAGHFIMEFNFTKFVVVKPLFKYLCSKFTGRVQGIINQSFKNLQCFSGRSGDVTYFQQRRVLTYKRKRFVFRIASLRRAKLDL